MHTSTPLISARDILNELAAVLVFILAFCWTLQSLYCYSSDELAVLHSVHFFFVGKGVFIFVIFFMNSKYLLIVVNHTRCQKLSIYFLSLIKLKKVKIVIFFSKKKTWYTDLSIH